jgi:hypothetical protein
MSEIPKVAYHSVEIEYRESENKWYFELRGRERSAHTLKDAKEIIDKPEPKEKSTFKRVNAIRIGYSPNDIEFIEVTSIAEKGRYDRETSFWTVANGNRQKRDGRSIYSDNEFNRAVVAKIQSLAKEIETLEKQQKELVQSMSHLELDLKAEAKNA